jgi:hypothetical protein
MIWEPYIPGSPGGFMKCPRCGEHTRDDWKPLLTNIPRPADDFLGGGERSLAEMYLDSLPLGDDQRESLKFDWMRCEDEACRQTVVRLHETTVEWTAHAPIQHTDTRFVYPLGASSPRDPLPEIVPKSMRSDYEEAAAILDISPRMTTVLTSKVLYDLLEKYAGIAEYTLNGSIKKFVADTSHPKRIRQNLGHWREIRDFSAHTKRNQNPEDEEFGQIIEAGREEADWTLDTLDTLFEYFITQPATDERLRAKWDRNIADADRNPIPPLPEDAE